MKKTVKLFAIVMALVLALMSGTAALAEESIVADRRTASVRRGHFQRHQAVCGTVQ